MKIYLAAPIAGLSYDQVMGYYKPLSDMLKDIGYEVLCPMTGKEYLSNEKYFYPQQKESGFTSELSSDKFILTRDKWMVHQSDIVYVNLIGAKRISIGCMKEQSYAYAYGKHIVAAMEEDNVHRHAFTNQEANIIFTSSEEAESYLISLKRGV